MLSGSQVQVGRDDLQGAYVAQKEFNDASKLQGGTQVRLLIANTGSQTSTATSNVNRVVQQIIRLQQSDPTFVGVMGWPFSARTQAAIQALSQAHIPMVSQTSSSDSLTDASPYFLRIVPPNTIQGTQGAKYAEQTLHAKKVALFYDENDSYSESLAQDFRTQFVVKDKNQVIEEKYTIGDAASIASAIQKVLSQHVDLIYFSGYASDVSTVLSNLPAGNLPVMGGDALYELGGYQSSARVNFSRLRFTAFAYPDEWTMLGYAAQTPAFFAEYSAAFNPDGQHPGGAYGFTRTDNDVMLSYDATVALLTAYNNALGSGKKNPTPEDENQALHAINGSKAIQGVGGQIAFGSNGDPIDKAIVVLYVDQLGRIHMEPTVLGRFLK
jgi:ABC-type branched-subunit amino acid transport system substrate-binding protein